MRTFPRYHPSVMYGVIRRAVTHQGDAEEEGHGDNQGEADTIAIEKVFHE